MMISACYLASCKFIASNSLLTIRAGCGQFGNFLVGLIGSTSLWLPHLSRKIKQKFKNSKRNAS